MSATNVIFIKNNGEAYNLLESGGFVVYKPTIELPIKRVMRRQVLGQNSELTVDYGTYGDRETVLPVVFVNWENAKSLFSFLNGDTCKMYLSYEEGYYKVSEVNSIYPRDAKGVCEVDINLTLESFVFLEENNVIIVNDNTTILNDGDVDSECILEAIGEGDCTIYINSQKFDLKGIEGHITLNSITKQIYKDLINKGDSVIGDINKMLIKKGENTITFTGDISKINLTFSPKLFK